MAKKIKEISSQSSVRRQQLLDAALSVVARRGLSGITVNDIADEAGCSYGVIAFHFKTKERLLLAVLDLLASNYEKIWLDAMASAAASPAERLRLLIDVDFDPRVAKTKHLAVWMAFWAEAPRVPAYKKRCSELKYRSLDTMVTLVTELAAERAVTVDAMAIARGLYAITDGCWIFSHVTGENSPQMRERSRQVCLTFLSAFFPSDFAEAGRAVPA
ncbi:TetR family transcriptional regulator C-terminal domain-containing protein [Shinella sp. NM-101]|uniref:TetR family transcriptional regulator C-terminal domain-containing protein n=1 Tax=Shinella sp. NM-101 TaxID=2744455 RepID=UPI001F39DDB8|nr:TetR family transcriptional regulator C-terminal domain-containing protein [Shinella sp. NM-101]WPE23537.1 HTH-type transcriptional regulator BetI [Shinella zoogloeoides]